MMFFSSTNRLFGSFRQLTREQIVQNARLILAWLMPVSVVLCGVIGAVLAGIIWIAVVATVICLSLLIYISRKIKTRYSPRFSVGFNSFRFLLPGVILYNGAAWRALYVLYNRLYYTEEWQIPASIYGWSIVSLGVILYIMANFYLFRITDVQLADLLGLVEAVSVLLAIGGLMFLIIYA